MEKRRLLPSLAPLDVRIRDEQVAMLYARNRSPNLVGIPFGLACCAFAWSSGRHSLLAVWFALKCLSAGVRVALDAAYNRDARKTAGSVWETRYSIALAVDGFVWSLLIILFADPSETELAPIVIAAVIGVASSGLVALSTDRRANAIFATTLLAPAGLRLLLLGTRLGTFGGFSLFVFLGLVIEHGMRVSQATKELLRLRFEVAHARDAALAAGRAKSEFLATMSHELRTPLNAVIGMSTLLADTQLTPDQRERMDLIRSSGETLLTLIGDILDVSKIEAGKLDVESAPVEIARVVELALEQIAPAAYEKGLEIGYGVSEDCPVAVLSDPTRVRQILTNLLGNAVKFTSSGAIVVDVTAKSIEGGRAEVTFSIRDTGIGIEPDAVGRLFSPFTQADATTTRRYGGTGLGLAICKSLSELLGGTIGVESAVGRGSTFHFSIVGPPLDQPRLRALPINVGSKVCVVSGDPTALRILAGHVERFGLAASQVASLAGALENVAAGGADLVVLDVRDGRDEAADALRALRSSRASLPVVVLMPPRTGSLPGSTAPADPLVAVVSKPLKTQRLLEVIEALLAGQPAPARQSSIADVEPPVPTESATGTALVVDDNDLNRRVALEMVRRLGLSARAVESGAQAIEALRIEHFDYVLMDVQMPDMDGFEATRQILKLGLKRKPRIIAMTANALPGDRERCLAAGMSDYVTKPVRPHALAAALKQRYAGTDGTERSGITDVLDAQVLEDLRMLEETSGASLMADLAASFRTDVPARIADLRTAAGSGDAPTVKAIAHRLRGSAGAVGANRVFMTATEIESRVESMAAPAVLALVEQLAKEAARAIDAFDRVLERMRDGGAARRD